MSIRVLLADDHGIMRDGLRALLEREHDITVVAEASNGRDAVTHATKYTPDVAVMDVAMPLLNGIEATRQIVNDCPGCKVIILSTHVDRRYVSAALEAGARGYVIKDAASTEVVGAIRIAAQNKTFLSPDVADMVVSGFVGRDKPGDASAYALLTPREREVLQLLAEGKATKEIAAELLVSVKTIETHRAKIMQKLELRSVAELTKYAVREGITSLG